MRFKNIPISVEANNNVLASKQRNPLQARVDLGMPRPLRVCFPVLLDGDLVLSPEHLGPAYLVAVLRQANATCKIVEVAMEDGCDEIIKDIVDWQPDIIGISLTTISVPHATKFGHLLKKNIGKETFLLGGGPLATHLGKELLEFQEWYFFDGIVRGEGEVPMLRFAEAFHTDKNYQSVPNFIYRHKEQLIENAMEAGISDLNLLPQPARDQFEINKKKLPYLRISTSRGCTSHCTFCNAPHTKNRVGPRVKGWRGQSPERVVEEIEDLYHNYKFNTFDFVDSTFEDPGGRKKAKERIAEIARLVLEKNLTIYYNVCMQAYNWHDEDKPLLNLLWRSGLEKSLVGIESGSDMGLQRWQKKSTVEDNVRVIKLLREANIYVAFGFISFHPWSTFNEIRENCEFLRRNMGYNLRRFTVRLELYPGAEVVDQLRDDGLLLDSYTKHLNTFGYHYEDDRIAQLANTLNGLYGKEYEDNCLIDEEPAVFKFETYDIILHTYYTRLLRHYGQYPKAKKILDQFNMSSESIKNEMSTYNYQLISTFIDKAENRKLRRQEVYDKSDQVEKFYQKKLDEFRSLQLKTSMALHRNGYNVNVISNQVN